MGQKGPLGAKKMTFFKNDPGPHGMPKRVFLARFELVVARFSPPKVPKCLECNYEAKRHSQTCFGMQPNHGGCLLCCYTGYLGIFSSFWVLKVGLFLGQKWVKN